MRALSIPAARLLGRRAIGRLCGAIALIAHAPLVSEHLTNLWRRPHYQFVALLLPLAGWMIWQRWPRGEVFIPARRLESGLLIGSVALLAAGLGLNSPYLAALSAIFVTGFIILHRAGLRAIGRLLAPWLLLWLAVPPPLGFDLWLISSMQSVTSLLASRLLDAMAINHLMEGNVLQLPGRSFFVDEACSGVHSLFAMLALTGVFVVITSRPVVRGVLLLAGSLGWALVANLLRVVAIALAHVWWGRDLSAGWPHDVLGLATFLFALLLTLSTDCWLQFVAHVLSRLRRSITKQVTPRTRRRPVSPATVAEQHLASLRERERSVGITRRSAAMRIAAIGSYSLLIAADVSGLTPTDRSEWVPDPLQGLSPNLLPTAAGQLQRVHFERVERDFSSDFGRTSLVWTYAGAQTGPLQVSLDASFGGWHELSRCYEGLGWTLQARQVVPLNGIECVEATLVKPTGEQACLVFALLTLDGRVLTPTRNQGATRLIDRLADEQALQWQVFAESGGPVDAPLRQQALNLLQLSVERHVATCRGEGNG